MPTTKNSNQMKFWMVLLGLFLLIGLVAGGTYILNDQGLISAGNTAPGELSEGAPPDLEEGAAMPERPEGGSEGMGFNSQALVGVFKALLQISLVVAIVAGSQWLISWLQRRRRRSPRYSS